MQYKDIVSILKKVNTHSSFFPNAIKEIKENFKEVETYLNANVLTNTPASLALAEQIVNQIELERISFFEEQAMYWKTEYERVKAEMPLYSQMSNNQRNHLQELETEHKYYNEILH